MTIHTALVAEQSPVLRNLVTGPMKEAQAGKTTWEDLDEGTFARFAQFVYTGDYPPAPWEVVVVEPPEPEPPVRDEENEFASSAEPPNWPADPVEMPWGFEISNKVSTKGKKGKRGYEPRSTFHQRVYPLPNFSKNMTDLCKPRPNESANENYTPVFLGHARLYVFAEKYGIEELKALTLHKLHSSLCVFSLYQERYKDVLELLKYTYDNTPSRSPLDGLRELVSQYISCEGKQVTTSEQCLSLVEEGGPLARDLFLMMQ